MHKPDQNFAFSGRIRPRLRCFRLVKAAHLVQIVDSGKPHNRQFGTPGSTICGTNCRSEISTTTPGYVSERPFRAGPGDHGALHRPRNASATTLRFFSLPPRGVLQWLEEQSGSGCGESGSIAGQSQHQRLQRQQHHSSPGSPVTVFVRSRSFPCSRFLVP